MKEEISKNKKISKLDVRLKSLKCRRSQHNSGIWLFVKTFFKSQSMLHKGPIENISERNPTTFTRFNVLSVYRCFYRPFLLSFYRTFFNWSNKVNCSESAGESPTSIYRLKNPKRLIAGRLNIPLEKSV